MLTVVVSGARVVTCDGQLGSEVLNPMITDSSSSSTLSCVALKVKDFSISPPLTNVTVSGTPE